MNKKSKKITQPKTPTRYLYLDIKEKCVASDSEGEGWEWDRSWYSHYDSDVLSVSKEEVKGSSIERFEVSEEVYESENFGVVWVIHTDGDSFGSSSGRISIACITDRQEILDSVNQALEDDNKYVPYGEKRKTISFRDIKEKYQSSGSYFAGYSSWDGYFNRIESIESKIFELKRVPKLK